MDDTDYAFGRTHAEYARLIQQAELFRPLTERMLLAAGIKRGMHVLDVGCGVGDVSFLAAALVGPEGSVVGVDFDAEVLKLAEERRAAKRITNVGFRESDARLINGGRLFDAAVGRCVLMFMRDPTATLRQIAERVRPGGIVAFQEWDARVTITSAMNQPVLARLQDFFVRTFERSGARSEIGAELYSRMLGCGPRARPLSARRDSGSHEPGRDRVPPLGTLCAKRAPKNSRVWPRYRKRHPRCTRRVARRVDARSGFIVFVVAYDRSVGL